jgi:CRP-like cAMP-binding protein
MLDVEKRVKDFFSCYPLKEFRRGEVILNPSAETKFVYFLLEGFVKEYTVSKEGRVKSVNIFKPGAYFPIVLAIADYENNFYFEAVNSVKAHEAPVADVLKLVMRDTPIIMNLCKRFLIGVDGIMNILQSIMYENSRKKLAAFILMLGQRFGTESKNAVKIAIPLTHQDIASFTGMIRETVSFEMKRLQKEGILADNNRRKNIEVLNISALEKILSN